MNAVERGFTSLASTPGYWESGRGSFCDIQVRRNEPSFDCATEVYVLGAPNSGSTIFTNMLNAHPEMVSLGEPDKLRIYKRREHLVGLTPSGPNYQEGCIMCGSNGSPCPVWTPEVLDQLAKCDASEFHSIMHGHLPGKILVDSAKNLDWFEDTAGAPSVIGRTPKVVVIARAPHAYVEAQRRLNKSSFEEIGKVWADTYDRILETLHRRAQDYMVLQFEHLCLDPDYWLREVCAYVGVEYSPKMCDIGSAKIHAIGGNGRGYLPHSDYVAPEFSSWHPLRYYPDPFGGWVLETWKGYVGRDGAAQINAVPGLRETAAHVGYDIDAILADIDTVHFPKSVAPEFVEGELRIINDLLADGNLYSALFPLSALCFEVGEGLDGLPAGMPNYRDVLATWLQALIQESRVGEVRRLGESWLARYGEDTAIRLIIARTCILENKWVWAAHHYSILLQDGDELLGAEAYLADDVLLVLRNLGPNDHMLSVLINLLSSVFVSVLGEKLERDRGLHASAYVKAALNARETELRISSAGESAPGVAIEAVAQRCLSALSDDVDAPEVWKILEEQSDNCAHIVEYLNRMRLGVRDSILLRNLDCIVGVAMAYAGDLDGAQSHLDSLLGNWTRSPLVHGALFRVYSLQNPDDPRYDLSTKFCPRPFDRMDVLEGGSHICCSVWLPTSVGDVREDEWEDVWNSATAQEIRASIFDGTYKFCTKVACPLIMGDALVSYGAQAAESDGWADIIAEEETKIPRGPEIVNLSYDRTCNLSCPSCRPERFASGGKERAEMDVMQERNIFPMLSQAKAAMITGSGDPFASKNFRNVLSWISEETCPDLKVQLMTNGMLLTPKEWEKFPNLSGRVDLLRVSIDGVSAESHERLRRGSKWETMLQNLEFISSLRETGEIETFHLGFLVQRENFHEMGDAVDFARGLAVDQISFARITNWGTWSDEEYNALAVFLPDHPCHGEFLEAMQDSRLRDEIVFLGNLDHYRPFTDE